jgi:hypothetical protein
MLAYSGSNLCSIISSILELVKRLLNFNLLVSAHNNYKRLYDSFSSGIKVC